jgi:ankyrin repeat protein
MNIHNAAWNGDMNRVRTLLNQGVSLNSVNRAHNHTPLVIAAKRGHLPLVKYLINKNASRNKNIQDAFTEALRSGHEKIVEYLIKKGANVNAKNRMNHTPLLIAATRGRSNMPLNKIKKLLDILVRAKAKNMSYLKNHPNSRERKMIDNAIIRNNKRKNSRSATMFTTMSFKGNHGRMDPHVAHKIASLAGY